MAVTVPYLTGGTHQRSMSVEQNFSAGMQYTDNPLDEGYSKLLINYSVTDGTLKPRPALRHVETFGAGTAADDSTVIATGLIDIYTDPTKTDTKSYRVALVGGTVDDTAQAKSTRLVVYGEDGVVIGQPVTSTKGFIRLQESVGYIHDLEVTTQARRGVYAFMDGVMYLSRITDTTRTLCYLEANWNTAHNAVTYEFKDITPNDVTAVKAVNYGYNMLKPDPYTFSNASTSAGVLLLDGIVPYDTNGNIVTSARVGAEVIFKLVYRYPQADVTSNYKYYVQWELQDLNGGDTQVIQYARQSQAYAPGDDISITTRQTVYKQFTIICKVYYKHEIDAQTTASDIELAVKVTPKGTMTLAYYYLTNDKDTTQQNLSTKNYDLMTATGMCYWLNRLVVWGVQNCKNTLWISEINDPTYFPYPNNIELFETDIVKCVAYKKTLLVFTTTGIYQMEYAEDGLTLTNSVVQENMTIDAAAASSIIPVQNMVTFMAGNYYYMIVPAKITTTQAGQLTLAPISKPINDMLDNFSDFIYSLKQIMNLEGAWEIYDWHCYLEQEYYRAVYKIRYANTKFIDIVLQYDTKFRTWTVHTYYTGSARLIQYINSVTGQSVYITCTKQSALSNVDLWYFAPSLAQDEDINGNVVPMFQYVDTGYRRLNEYTTLNKKWRQMQFTIANQDGQPLSFASEFRVDNDLRKQRYGYVAETDPDDGSVTVNYELLDDDIDVPGLAWYTNTANEWGYDTHNFPDVNTAKVKVNVNGKGRLPRFILTSHNTVPYEINSISWVFRTMTGR